MTNHLLWLSKHIINK